MTEKKDKSLRFSLIKKYHQNGPAFIVELENEIAQLKARLDRPVRQPASQTSQSLVARLRVSRMEELQY